MEYTPEEKSLLIKDLHLLHRDKRNKEECGPFLRFKPTGLKEKLLPDAGSKRLTKTKLKVILADLLSEGHSLLKRPQGSADYWLVLGTEDAPKQVDTVRETEIPDSDLPEGFLEFEEKARAILKRNFTQKKLLDLFQATAPIFQSS